jgi:hypothetical protein
MHLDLFCPLCGSTTLMARAVILALHYAPHTRFEFRLGSAIVCQHCALVSEVSSAGQLIDLGDISVSDIMTPPGSGDRLTFACVSAIPVMNRRES